MDTAAALECVDNQVVCVSVCGVALPPEGGVNFLFGTRGPAAAAAAVWQPEERIVKTVTPTHTHSYMTAYVRRWWKSDTL